MKIHFYLRYYTQFGQSLSISTSEKDGLQPMEYLNDDFWHLAVETTKTSLQYRYHFQDRDGQTSAEWTDDRSIDCSTLSVPAIQVIDNWNDAGAYENAFLTKPFREIFLPEHAGKITRTAAAYTHLFKAKAPLLKPDEVLCLLGHGAGLRHWDSEAPILLQQEGDWWTARLDLSKDDFPLGYKYGVWNTRTHRFLGFEEGSNRTLYTFFAASGREKGVVVLHDGFARLPNNTWRGSGVAIPVFSLRTKKSFGVGEFTDLHALADWAQSTGLKLLQLLPVNDTSATGTWTDSYPYAAISAFALHPIYLNVEQVAGKKHAEIIKPYAAQKKELNAAPAVEYEAVMNVKWEIIRKLFEAGKEDWKNDKAYQTWFDENKSWLLPYACFCHFRDKYGTVDFNLWPTDKSFNPKAKTPPETAIHLFVQWHLHLQLKNAAQYAHSRGLALKGDIPIGIYRYSCDAWVAPELYNMDQQAGAPPDDFAVKGQNWGFPTYNWARMKQDGFEWWRQRFAQMKLYFDAFRIDHILGFFRIWSIPLDAVEGILGHFAPAIPVTEREFLDAGIGFNFERLCQPFITDAILQSTFGEHAAYAAQHFLDKISDDIHLTGNVRYTIKPAFHTQRKVEDYFEAEPATDENIALRNGLFNLITNVILFKDEASRGYHFRYGIDQISSFQVLPDDVKARINALYVDYFYRRQDIAWKKEAMDKLPALKRSTNMLICGEDLGMVPACVPDVMRDLGILSLEIQRMPKQTGLTFFNPKNAPYLSVVTPSTHDMSTIRGWWEENRMLTQRFFNEELGYAGNAPYFCEPWINQAILAQHFQSPAMWAIFQIQDLLGMSPKYRRENPADERINVPANPKHFWQYRMHLSLEDLAKADEFNNTLREMIAASGRG
jgi:4-alpha-glucanotransferase